MAAVVVLPPSQQGTKTEAEHMEVDSSLGAPAAAEEDLYTRLKTLQRQLEFLEIQVRPAWGPLPAARVQAGVHGWVIPLSEPTHLESTCFASAQRTLNNLHVVG